MNRRGLLILTIALALFVVVGAFVIFGNQGHTTTVRAYAVTVTGTSASPSHLTAHQGDTLIIKVSADKKEEIHLHGYDKHFFVDAGKPVTQTFKADKTGDFDIEVEDLGKQVADLEVDP